MQLIHVENYKKDLFICKETYKRGLRKRPIDIFDEQHVVPAVVRCCATNTCWKFWWKIICRRDLCIRKENYKRDVLISPHSSMYSMHAINITALQHTATHGNTLQQNVLNDSCCTATQYNTLQHTAFNESHCTGTHCNTLQHTATHCNTLQHTATH